MADVDHNYGTLYRMKPTEVRAIKVNKRNFKKIAEWANSTVVDEDDVQGVSLESGDFAVPGEHYVCRTTDGYYYAVEVADFEVTYDEVEVSRV